MSGVLSGMNRRTQGRSRMDRASFELEQYYSDFERDFKIVFEDINQMSAAFLNPY